jgi:hypothetical protein
MLKSILAGILRRQFLIYSLVAAGITKIVQAVAGTTRLTTVNSFAIYKGEKKTRNSTVNSVAVYKGEKKTRVSTVNCIAIVTWTDTPEPTPTPEVESSVQPFIFLN